MYCDVLYSHLERNGKGLLKIIDWKQSLLPIKFTFVKKDGFLNVRHFLLPWHKTDSKTCSDR